MREEGAEPRVPTPPTRTCLLPSGLHSGPVQLKTSSKALRGVPSGRSGEQLCLLALTRKRRNRAASSLGGRRERGRQSLGDPGIAFPQPERDVSIPAPTLELQDTAMVFLTGRPVPGLASGCGRSWVSAWGPQCPGLARSMASATGSARPVPEGAARGLGVASDSGGLGTSRPRSARPGAVVAVEETDVCWHRSAPGQRGCLHPSPLRPAHASVLGSCEPLCEGRSSDATDGTVVRLGSQDTSLAATLNLPQCTLGRVVRSCKNASDHPELPFCVSSKSELVKYGV